MNTLRWWYYELKRLERLVWPEPSVKLLIDVVGVFWLWRHGAKREYRIKLWAGTPGWYATDIAFPHIYKALEADGSVHRGRQRQDVVRDHRLGELGWEVMRIDVDQLRKRPQAVRRSVRAFIKR